MLLSAALVVLAVPVLLWTTYLAVLALLSWGPVPGCRDPLPSAVELTKFDVVVPAHDEAAGIAETVRALVAMEYPADRRRVLVVADNCRDDTARLAREAGATVLERCDEDRRGKGYALQYAFDTVFRDAFADAVVVVDADTRVTANLLRAFDARLRSGARAVQAEYRVLNPQASWRTRLMRIGFTLFHDVRSRARERLSVSTGLRGNGMAFSVALLKEVPHQAFSIVEDVEYGIRLGLAGHRVHYAGEAQVFGEMVSSEAASRSQRRRWEGGRGALAKQYASKLLGEAIRRRSLVLFDLAADLLVPPLTYVVLAALVGTLAAAAWMRFGSGSWRIIAPWGAAWMGLFVYVIRGAWLAHVGPRVILDLAWAPVYMVWKVVLATRPGAKNRGEWVRTARGGEKVP
jgi:1,2-diacylglycerol 3-beta-glucosyltransferase